MYRSIFTSATENRYAPIDYTMKIGTSQSQYRKSHRQMEQIEAAETQINFNP